MTSESVIPLVEVLGFAEAGLSRPLRCRGADGYIYYVKGQQANRSSLWAEWLCGHAAQAFGLNIPAFRLVQLDETLWRELPTDYRMVGCLPAFGSQQHPQANWMEPSMAAQVNQETQRDILVFDWWIRNKDRTKGNTNLLWNAQTKNVIVMDHNLAFDPDFGPAIFLDHHIFGAEWAALETDLVLQAQYSERLSLALAAAQVARQSAPEEWMWENSEFDVPTPFDADAALNLLARCATPELWRTV